MTATVIDTDTKPKYTVGCDGNYRSVLCDGAPMHIMQIAAHLNEYVRIIEQQRAVIRTYNAYNKEAL